jgi:uncharacterized protein with FMN-binding domain
MTSRCHRRSIVILAFCCGLVFSTSLRADVIELAGGNKVEGRIIARDNDSITIETTVGGRTFKRRWTLEKIRAITVGDQREVLHAEPAGDSAGPAAGKERSPAEVKALIEKLGREQPDWWDSVAVNYPKTLDLNWPKPPFREWNNQRYIGQYVWDIINPNPGKWREGIRLMHHLLMLHKDNAELRARAMNELGRMYFSYLQDYARAAFWWQAADVESNDAYNHGVSLAECYWRLGSRPMAMQLLSKLRPQFSMIKLWAEMGELKKALALADANAVGPLADVACLYAGDACRAAGQHSKAIEYYGRVLNLPATGHGARRVIHNQQRAQASIEAIRLFDTLDLKRIADGTYRGSSLGYEAQVAVEVTVQGGRIKAVDVKEHHEKQVLAALTDTPRKILAKQSVKGIDATTGATITSQAIIHATAKALAKGMK